MSEKEIDDVTGVETTGHEWDGIRELNNPLPRWWVWIFYISIAWSIVYWIFMPAWPGISGYTKGTRNHSERENVNRIMGEIEAERGVQMAELLNISSIEDVEKDPQLLQYTMNAGASLFGDNCATCHGAGGQGVKGYPSLVDDAWIWGGTLQDIEKTLHHGIRSTHPDTRFNLMQAYGKDGILTRDQISDLTDYVISLSGGEADPAAVARAEPIFAQQCVACHMEGGVGNTDLGAPALNDKIWLYGGDRLEIAQTLTNGRAGVMPYWTDRLSEEQITALAVYVHSLGGGQ